MENQEKKETGFIEDHLLLLPIETFEVFMQAEHPGEVVAVYLFYYYTAKWQDTRQPRATNNYVRKGLNIGRDRMERAQKWLIEKGFIEQIARRDASGMITGWYMRVNYTFREQQFSKAITTTEGLPEIQKPDQMPENRQVEQKPDAGFTTSGKTAANAYNNISLNAKDNIIKECLDFSNRLKDRIKQNNPEARITEAQIKNWTNEARLMIERDGRTLAKMIIVLDWSQSDSFWSSNILSMATFRKQYDKLTMQMNRPTKKTSLLTRERGLAYEVHKKPANI